jgi:hypothetical protein
MLMIITLMRFMAIVFLVIALAILAASNPLPAMRLVFLGWQTAPISLGIWGLAAVGSGLAAGLSLRVALWSYLASRMRSIAKKTKIARKLEDQDIDEQLEQLEPPDYNYRPAQQFAKEAEKPDSPPDSPIDKLRDRFDNYSRPKEKPEPEPNVVRDANYRVITPPQDSPKAARPQVESTLKPDNQDWGFDFDDEE